MTISIALPGAGVGVISNPGAVTVVTSVDAAANVPLYQPVHVPTLTVVRVSTRLAMNS